MTRVVIKDGRIITAVDDYVADILSEDGRIRTIGLDLPAGGAEVHHADGLLVLPGGVDDHHSRVDYSLFEGFEVTGKVEKMFSHGRLVVDGSSWLGADGWGRYVRRSASGYRDGGAGSPRRPLPGLPPGAPRAPHTTGGHAS